MLSIRAFGRRVKVVMLHKGIANVLSVKNILDPWVRSKGHHILSGQVAYQIKVKEI